MKHRPIGFSLGLSALLGCGVALAQVNVEPLRRQIKRGGVGGRVRTAMLATGGNTDRLSMGGGLLLGGDSGPHFAYLNLTGEYARVNREATVAKAFSHLRYNYELAPWLWAEAFTQLEADRFRRIARRELVGSGPRFGVDFAHAAVFYGTAYMAEWTLLDRRDTSDSGELRLAHRWSNYVSASGDVAERVLLTTTVYLQPRFDAFGDYHALVVATFEFKVSGLVSTGIEAEVRYESRPADEVEKLDYSIKNALELSF